MSPRSNRRIVVVLLGLLAVGLAWFVTTDTTPHWHTERGDHIAAQHTSDPAALASQDRRAPRITAASPATPQHATTPAGLVAAGALLALLAAALAPHLDVGPRHPARHHAASLRAPPASIAVPVA